jgi:hypothetical protein
MDIGVPFLLIYFFHSFFILSFLSSIWQSI